MSKVTIYTTSTCTYCKSAKQFFKENDVEYDEKNVGDDQKAAEEMVAKSGQMGVPVIIVNKDGKDNVIVGFDQPKLMNLLNIS